MWSSVEIVQSTASAGAATDLVTLEALKLELGITSTTEDEKLQAWITRYSKAIADALDRSFALTEVIETFVFGAGECSYNPLILSHWPVVEMYDVLLNDAAITDYELNATNGMLYRTNSGFWSGRVEAYYLGGYLLPDEAPAALTMAVIDAVRQGRAFSSSDATIRSVQHGDVSVGFYSAPQQGSHGLPASVISAISQFRRISV